MPSTEQKCQFSTKSTSEANGEAPADAADQLDFPGSEHSVDDSAEVSRGDEDFEAFTNSAQVLDVPKETKDGNIVLTAGQIKPEPKVHPVGEKPKESVEIQATTDGSEGEKAKKGTESSPQKIPHRFVTPKDFDLLKVIGMGAFGKVLQVRHKHTQRVLAMKVISKRILRKKTGYVENIQAERKILTRVRSPFVVTMHCSFQTKEKLFIVMDFLAGGELFLRLGREGIFLEKTAAFYLAEIILALDHLHSLGILHRDLKPENILLCSDGHVCVTDFGLARDFSDSGGFQSEEDEARALTICGTQEYMAPEMLSRQGYGRPADYWSLGCIAYEMLSGLPPFRAKGAKEIFRKIMTERVKMPSGSTAAACKLLKGLLNRNVQARLGTARSTMFEVGGVAGLKKLEFFKLIDWDKLERKEVEPPHILSVSDDHDLRHFHDEFTGMSLPRSVVEMSKEQYKPRRVDSEAFRGFSFVQEDFDLPERDAGELQMYFESTEEDAESVSECASSKLDQEEVLVEPEPVKKKRPPRKRKKKKQAAAGASVASTPVPSATNTPDASATNTPAPSENGDIERSSPKEEKARTLPVKLEVSNDRETSSTKPQSSQPKEALASNQSSKASAPSSKPATEHVWNQVSVSNSKKKAASNSTPVRPLQQVKGRESPARSNLAQQPSQPPRSWGESPRGQKVAQRAPTTNMNRVPQQSQRSQRGASLPQQEEAASRPTPWSRKTKQGGAWGNPSPSIPLQRSGQAPVSRDGWNTEQPPPPAPDRNTPPASPSSDWRQHNMSPHDGKRTVRSTASDQSPVWPSLASDPPLTPQSTAKVKNLQGAWASRAKA